ncbi:MAG TPA: pilus assembly protein, partial [Hyalangium sp.]|nr:pilus assembly protein [Hyalangium sp.]
LPRIELLRTLGAGQQSLVADYYWLQAIQATGRGGSSLEATRYLDLFYYADLVTDLDPKFYKVYTFSGNTIPTNLGRETWVNTAEARKILEKGVKHFPEDSTLRLYLAYNLSYFFNEHAAATEHLRIAASLPNVNKFVPEIATRMLAYNRRFDAALEMVKSFRDNETDPVMQKVFDERIQEIYREQALIQVDDALAAFKKREGRLPQQLSELVRSGDLSEIPVDPMGGVIYITEEGKSASTSSPLRLEPIDYRKRVQNEEKKQQQLQAAPDTNTP